MRLSSFIKKGSVVAAIFLTSITAHSHDAPPPVLTGAAFTGGSFDFWGTISLQDSGAGILYSPPVVTSARAAAQEKPPKAVKQRVAREGGRIEHPGGCKLDVPSNALPAALDLAIEVLQPESEAASRRLKREAKGLSAAVPALDLGPEGTRFERPITITIPYDPKSLGNAREQDLRLYYWNPLKQDWEPISSSRVDPTAKLVVAQLTHFSLYQVLAPQEPLIPTALPDAAFTLRDLYAFPNPSRRGQSVVIRAQVGLADSIEVRIYDISGQLIHTGSVSSPQVLDDGNGKGAQYTFDYAWDPGSVGSGVYLYAVTAQKAGQPIIQKTGRIGVLK